MEEELLWGLPVIGYLFLAGVGAGALTVSASVFLRGGGGGFGGAHFDVARYGALIAPLPVIIGCALLVLELGQPFRFMNLYKVANLSPMSVGTWLLTFFIAVSLVYALTFVPRDARRGDWMDPIRTGLAWICVPLGILTAVYTGVLLGAMPARPFWNSPILALLFLMSSLSTGVAAILFARNLVRRRALDPEGERQFHESGYLLTASDLLLIGFELMVIFLFLMFSYLTVGRVQEATAVILFGGALATDFWLWVVLIGLLIPALVEMFFVIPRLVYHKHFAVPWAVELVVPAAILLGGFMLRYVVVIAGQITGPVGI